MVALNVVLAHPFAQLLLFPEGETKYEINDTLHRLRFFK